LLCNELKDGKPDLIHYQHYQLKDSTYIIPKIVDQGCIQIGKHKLTFDRATKQEATRARGKTDFELSDAVPSSTPALRPSPTGQAQFSDRATPSSSHH